MYLLVLVSEVRCPKSLDYAQPPNELRILSFKATGSTGTYGLRWTAQMYISSIAPCTFCFECWKGMKPQSIVNKGSFWNSIEWLSSIEAWPYQVQAKISAMLLFIFAECKCLQWLSQMSSSVCSSHTRSRPLCQAKYPDCLFVVVSVTHSISILFRHKFTHYSSLQNPTT